MKKNILILLWLISTNGFSQRLLTKQGSPINPAASLFITNTNVVNAFDRNFNKEYSMGYLMGAVGKRYQNNTNFGTQNDYTLGLYANQVFNLANRNQLEYKNYMESNPNAESMGAPAQWPYTNGKVIQLWDQKLGGRGALSRVTDINQLKNGPFRLLAIVNRMDLALDRDPRNSNEITFDPRSLGELHLIYGLVDPSTQFEGATNPKPFPMVFVMAYRIPAIRENTNGTFTILKENTSYELAWREEGKYLRKLDPNYGGNSAINNWKAMMKIWAKRFSSLSDNRSGRKMSYNWNYIKKVKNILDDVIDPVNFLSLKSNTKINESEHELREWYTIASSERRFLIPRRMRREPHHCLENSTELAGIIDMYWVNNRNHRGSPNYLKNDLDMFTRDFNIGNSGRRQEEKAGLEVLRDNFRNFLSDKTTGRGVNLRWKSETCGKKANEMPFEMSDNGRLLMLPQFARVRGDRVWQLPHVSGNAALKERKRHAFAMRTCTGCHSKEGGTQGFHVFNRLTNEQSKLSPFLIGDIPWLRGRRSSEIPANISNVFRNGGATYRHDTLKDRMKFLYNSLHGNIRPYENLILPEFRQR